MLFDTLLSKGFDTHEPKVLIPMNQRVWYPWTKGFDTHEPKGLIPMNQRVWVKGSEGGAKPPMQRCILSSIFRNGWGIVLSVNGRSFG
jgi:hypothetical protein